MLLTYNTFLVRAWVKRFVSQCEMPAAPAVVPHHSPLSTHREGIKFCKKVRYSSVSQVPGKPLESESAGARQVQGICACACCMCMCMCRCVCVCMCRCMCRVQHVRSVDERVQGLCTCAERVQSVCTCAGRVQSVCRACAERVRSVCGACAERVQGVCRTCAERVQSVHTCAERVHVRGSCARRCARLTAGCVAVLSAAVGACQMRFILHVCCTRTGACAQAKLAPRNTKSVCNMTDDFGKFDLLAFTWTSFPPAPTMYFRW